MSPKFSKRDIKRRILALQAVAAYTAYMQYTLRNIPSALDSELRAYARAQNKSLNEAAIQALSQVMGLSGQPMRYRHLNDIAGTWVEDATFDQAIAEQHHIDQDLWR